MDELISREMALNTLEDAKITVTGMRFGKTILAEYMRQVREGYIDILKTVPSADANWTRHGSWKSVGKTEHGSIIRECTACGVQKAGRVKSDYCPDCGARMNKTDDAILGQDSFLI